LVWHFLGICLIVIIMRYKNSFMRHNHMWSIMVFGLIDTLPHEIAHWIVALLTGGRPFGFSIVPKKVIVNDKKVWTFGSVSAYVTTANAFLIGFAPLIWLVVAYYIFINFFKWFGLSPISILSFYFIVYVCIENSIPSMQDIKVAFSQWSWIFYLFLAILIYVGYKYYYGVYK